MMKATELMIGDWVYNTCNRQPEQVCEIMEHMVMLAYNDLYDYDEIEPIPLTSDILERNGFVLQKESSIAKEYICARGGGPDHNLFVTVFKNRDFVKVYYCPIDASTMIDVNIPHCAVHQLQHALRLCGIDKEITIKED